MTSLALLAQLSLFEKLTFTMAAALKIAARMIGGRHALEVLSVLRDVEAQGNRAYRQGTYTILQMMPTEEIIEAYQLCLRRYGSDFAVFKQVFLEKEYLPLVSFVKMQVEMSEVKYVVDAGANIGCTTIYLKKVFPTASIISIEPDTQNFQALVKNITINQLAEVHPVQGGLWSSNEWLTTHHNFRDGRDWSIAVRPAPVDQSIEARTAIQGITLDYLLSQYHFPQIDVLKMDIEGAEQVIFQPDGHVSDFLERVHFIGMETHPELGGQQKVLDTLHAYGFTFFFAGESLIAQNLKFRPIL